MIMKSIRITTLPMAACALAFSSLSLHASESDDKIESSMKNSYVFRTYLKDDKIKTKSEDGVVTLTGSVEQGFHKTLAEDTAGALDGVKSVDNQITIREEGSGTQDKWIRLKIETSLLFHRNVDASSTKVVVDDGNVTLSGEATDKTEKTLATEYASDVEGVKSVKNEMTLAKTPDEPRRTVSEQMDDASITALVKSSLLVHYSTSAVKTTVETRIGVVTVGGVAENALQRNKVSKLAAEIHGVDKVINNMSLKSN
jgi:hyperosmotically inducible periplasmic protein